MWVNFIFFILLKESYFMANILIDKKLMGIYFILFYIKYQMT